MLKSLALAMAMTAIPLPRQTSLIPAHAGGGINGQPQGNDNQTQTTSTPTRNATPNQSDKGNGVKITDVPQISVSVQRDRFDRSYWVFSGLLVVVGAFQVVLLWRTWKKATDDSVTAAATTQATLAAIERQAKEMSRQNKNTISRERARLTLEPVVPTEIEVDLPWQSVEIKIDNVGYSHAFNTRLDARCELTMTTDEPVAETNERPSVGLVRAGGEKGEAYVMISATAEIWNNVVHAGAKNLYLHLWGTMEYEDVFGGTHPNRFQYVFQIHSLKESTKAENEVQTLPISALSILTGWKKCSHPEHNQQD